MNKPAILLIEDEDSDRLFLKLAFQKTGIEIPVLEVTDGQEAIDYFKGNGQFAHRDKFPIPYLVLLDLKLPYVMGLEVLTWIKSQPAFHSVIVIVFSASDQPADIAEAYKAGASAYLVKPVTMAHLRKMVHAIKDFWLEENEAPPSAVPFILSTATESIPAPLSVSHSR